jgi:hypothetical protein
MLSCIMLMNPKVLIHSELWSIALTLCRILRRCEINRPRQRGALLQLRDLRRQLRVLRGSRAFASCAAETTSGECGVSGNHYWITAAVSQHHMVI